MYIDDKDLRRHAHYDRNYGISLNDYQDMWDAQEGRCKICGNPETHKTHKWLAVDHDHVTGKIRGLLCHNCNVMLGSARDNPKILEEAIRYLQLSIS